MSQKKSKAMLSEKRYDTLVIRLLVDRDGNIEGSLVDLNETVVGRFQNLESLPVLIRQWLTQANAKKSA